MDEDGFFMAVISMLILLVVLCIPLGMWGCPRYNVWQQGLAGEAALARATQDRKIKIAEAQAKLDSAQLLSEAEVIRAKGVAQAQEIINSTLTQRYIQWMQAEALNDKQCELIYVPTEAQLPVLEAGRFRDVIRGDSLVKDLGK